MSELITTPAVVTTILLPLLLATMMIRQALQTLARSLMPLVPLAALLTAALAWPAHYTLPGFMLGGTFVLDDISRLFLLLGGALLGAAALGVRPRRGGGEDVLVDVLLMLFSAALFMTILAGDALTYYAAITLAGYALYGLITARASGPPRAAGRVMVTLLVISDIALFELLLLMSKHSYSLGFSALHSSLLETQGDTAILAFLLVGIGIKAALVGVHFWLAPTLVDAPRAVRPLILGFVFCAGLLGGLRLLPLGLVAWPQTGELLQWLAGAMAVYATVTGVLQRHHRAVLAHALMVLIALWLMIGGWLLIEPDHLALVQTHWQFALLQSVFAAGALLLNGRRRLFTATAVVGAAGLSLTPLTLALASTRPDFNYLTLVAMGMALSLLAFRQWRLHAEAEPETTPVDTGRAAPVFAVIALFNAIIGAAGAAGPMALTIYISGLVIAALAGWYAGSLRPAPSVPPGDLVHLIRLPLVYLLRLGDQWGRVQLPEYTRYVTGLFKASADLATWSQRLHRLEMVLSRWVTGLFLVILIGLAIAVAALAL